MCGICGKIDFSGSRVDEGLLRRMNERLAHRGPDDAGIHLSHQDGVSCGLGHRRLSIIDLSAAGRQPMTNEDKSLWMVFNGEIYNFAELREELKGKGHHFSSRTDSEVILHLFEEEGAAGISRLSGMFAFALWSETTKTLVLARDGVGIKPLVYYWDGNRLLFASELRALLADYDVQTEIDLESLDIYLSLNYIPAPYTIFKNIRKLRPGYTLSVCDGKLEERTFWDVSAGGDETAKDKNSNQCGKSPRGLADENNRLFDFPGIKQTLFRTLEESVRSQMVADVPLGAFLSGGIDSSVIVGLMARNSARPIKTYSIGFSDMPMFDETSYAREVALFHHTDHHEIKLSSREMIGAVPDILAGLDEPFGDSSAVPTWIVARETVRDVKVALSGDGGDELFAGYRMYKGEKWFKRYRFIPRLIRDGLLEPLAMRLPESRDTRAGELARRAKKFLRGAKGSLTERFFGWNELFNEDSKNALLKEGWGVKKSPAPGIFAAALARPQTDALNRMLYADFKVSLPGDMLWKVDKMSMAHALEVRVPLLDQRFCELAFRIGGDWKIRHGQGKYIFIEAFKDILPKRLHNRPKWGFEMPIARWLKTDLKYLISEYLLRDKIDKQGIFNYPEIEKMVADLLESRRDTAWKLWNLIVFQTWHASLRR
ncbi:MAG: asparagine synthase (glutamine-hydrolyzing) [Syntrophales bacterium]|jgi:asparagine synthase (glutamine-hydrolysing)|nr:asparagine synthase (glutamine-hydrolyzing) [Syntrophales bacterium]